MDPADVNAADERLYEILLAYMESAERGAPVDTAEILARHPEFAPELKDFFDTWVRVEGLTEPVRAVSQVLLVEATRSAALPAAAAPPGGGVADSERPADTRPEDGGRLDRWLRDRQPLSAKDYPFLHATPHPGEIGRLGPYRLIEVVGRGGMGIVFRGEDVNLHRAVAVKVLRAELAADAAARERFLRESRSAAALEHDHVVTVYHVGEDNGVPYLGMQWLRGLSLEELLRHGPLGVPAVLRLGRQIALGLAAAHERNLIHRDIKPANLWIEPLPAVSAGPDGRWDPATEGRVKILDFGLARAIADESHLTQSGLSVGTPAYMAPEQVTGGSMDAACDLYSLGVVLYRLCTGRLPGPVTRSPGETVAAVDVGMRIRTVNPAVPPELAALVMQLLARDPADRPASAAAVAEQLRVLGAGPALPAGPETRITESVAPRPAGRRSWRRPLAAAVVALLALLPLGYLFGGTLVRFATNQGDIVIAVDDPETGVTVREGGAVIQDTKGQRTITLASGPHDLEVTVRDANGEAHFFTKSLVLRRGGKEIVNVRQELTRTTAANVPAVPSVDTTRVEPVVDPVLRAVDRVLALKGKVTVRAADREQAVQSARDLPAGARLETIDLSGTAASDADLAALAGATDLRNLRLYSTSIGDQGLSHLGGLKKLRILLLNNTRITDAGLALLAPLESLEGLDVNGTAVTGTGLVHLQQLKNLHVLNVYNTKLSDASLAPIAGLTGLRQLYLSDMPLTDAALVHLKGLTGLEMLQLHNLRITDAGLANLAGMKKLRQLNIPGTQITDAGLKTLVELPALEQLALDYTRVTDAGMPTLAALKQLRFINLGFNAGITDAGMAVVGTFTDWKHLGLSHTRVTDAGLAHLAGLTKLEILNLGALPITDAGLANFAGATRLSILYLNGTRINDASIKTIVRCNWPLEHLDLQDTRISAKSYAQLKTAYPAAKIPWSEPNRSLAETVLAAGGTVHVRRSGEAEAHAVRAVRDLPDELFMVTGYRLAGTGPVPPDLPQKLAALTDPKFDGLATVDFSNGPCDLKRLRGQLPKTVVGLILTNARVGDDDLVHLQGLALRRLQLDGCPVRGPGLAHLKAAPETAKALTDLSLARTQFGDAQTELLRGFPNLRRLDLAGCAIRGPGLVGLKDLPALRELILACPTLTDLFAEELGSLKQVETLSLAGSGLTDEGLKGLRPLAQLRKLDLTGTKVTDAGVAALQKDLPQCQVQRGPANGR